MDGGGGEKMITGAFCGEGWCVCFVSSHSHAGVVGS